MYKSTTEFFERKTRSSKIGTGRQSIYNICILNYCKLTFEFFKNYIFEKRRQFLNRVISATDGGVQKHYRVFAKQKLEVQKLARMPIFEPSRELNIR